MAEQQSIERAAAEPVERETRSVSRPVKAATSLQRQRIEAIGAPRAAVQRKLAEALDRLPRMAEHRAAQARLNTVAQRRATGLPGKLAAGVEALSGVSMQGVNVEYNSAKPAQLNAHAYAQGSNIHLAPGQEKHLPHEAWHVAQQRQGRVRATTLLKSGVAVNDDAGLEREADVMGARAARHGGDGAADVGAPVRSAPVSQRAAAPVQLRIDPGFVAWAGNQAVTQDLLDTFYIDHVMPEMNRALEYTPEDHLVANIRSARAVYDRRINALLNYNYPRNATLARDALDLLVHAVNAGLDAYDQVQTDGMSIPGHAQNINHAQPITAHQNQERLRRRQREGVMVTLGTQHTNAVRGLQSRQEGLNMLNHILGILTAQGINDGHVAIRGSAVRGSNRDRTRPYRPGTANDAQANDASDIDFFFTSPTLQHAIEQNGDHYEGGGNVHPDTLFNLLNGNHLNLPNAVDQPQMATAIQNFSTHARGILGRNADVTLIRVAELANFADDEYILV